MINASKVKPVVRLTSLSNIRPMLNQTLADAWPLLPFSEFAIAFAGQFIDVLLGLSLCNKSKHKCPLSRIHFMLQHRGEVICRPAAPCDFNEGYVDVDVQDK